MKETGESRDRNNLAKEINQLISDQIGPIAKLDKIQFVSGLPKTRSSKIMRRYRDWETDRKSTRLNSSHRL